MFRAAELRLNTLECLLGGYRVLPQRLHCRQSQNILWKLYERIAQIHLRLAHLSEREQADAGNDFRLRQVRTLEQQVFQPVASLHKLPIRRQRIAIQELVQRAGPRSAGQARGHLNCLLRLLR